MSAFDWMVFLQVEYNTITRASFQSAVDRLNEDGLNVPNLLRLTFQNVAAACDGPICLTTLMLALGFYTKTSSLRPFYLQLINELGVHFDCNLVWGLTGKFPSRQRFNGSTADEIVAPPIGEVVPLSFKDPTERRQMIHRYLMASHSMFELEQFLYFTFNVG